MSTFCGGNGSVPSFTPQELNEHYPGGILQSVGILPSPGSDGLANEAWIQQSIQGLETSGILPKPTELSRVTTTPFASPETNDPLATYVTNDRKFQDNIKKEYCFYEQRYFSALNSFLDSIANSSLKGNSQNVNAKLTTVKNLNYSLTVLTQLVNGISKYRHNKNEMFQKDINSVNISLQTRKQRLQEQYDILSKETSTADLHKRMVEYTLEKNKANQNLLTLYAVLNLVAIGMIVYVSRS
jgi:hypothetical protein